MDAARGYFDTNTGDHQHFFLEEEGLLIDIPGEDDYRCRACRCRPPGMAVDGWMWWSASNEPESLAAKYFIIRIILNY